jgi:hypothetical protein
MSGRSKGVLFNFNGTWTVPAGVSLVYITAVGGGGGGGCGYAINTITAGGGGGGAGEYCRRFPLRVTPGGVITIAVGIAGAAGLPGVPGADFIFGSPPGGGQPGGITSFTNGTNLFQLAPGQGGTSNKATGNVVAGFGGGVNHGGLGNQNNVAGTPGRPEGMHFCGGAAGGGKTGIPSPFKQGGVPCGAPGGPCEGTPGALGGLQGFCNGGSAGASSAFGIGGAGGPCNAPGLPAPFDSFGAGGGGGGGYFPRMPNPPPPPDVPGGAGRQGVVVIEYEE